MVGERYRVIKDLPSCRAGTILRTNSRNDLVTPDGCLSGLYIGRASGKLCFISGAVENPEEWLEKVGPEVSNDTISTRWRADTDGQYFVIGADTSTYSYAECGTIVNNACWEIGNYFKTREEAEAVKSRLFALQAVKDDAKGFEPDWRDSHQKKFVASFNCLDGLWGAVEFSCRTEFPIGSVPVFASKQDLVNSLDIHRGEWQLLFGVNPEEDNGFDVTLREEVV